MKQDLGHLSVSGPDRRQVWATVLRDDVLAQLLDLDLRIKNLPEGTAKDSTKEWLDDIGWALASGSLKPDLDLGREPAGKHSIVALRDHVESAETTVETNAWSAEFDHRNFGLATRLVWLVGAAIWATTATLLSIYSGSLPTGGVSEELARVWVWIFVAGLSGSWIAVTLRIFRLSISDVEYYFESLSPIDSSSPWYSRLSRFLRLGAYTAINAILRPAVGGLYAWIITLFLLTGLIFEPLVAPFVTDSGALDTDNTNGVLFFLAVGVAAGFSDTLVVRLLRRIGEAIDRSVVRQ